MGNLDHLYRQDLPHRAVAVYIYLADRANKDNTCWPAIPTIARDLKYSESTVRRAMKDLRKADTGTRGESSLLFRLRNSVSI